MELTKNIEELLTPIAQQENIEIVDIEYVREDGKNVLRIYIDHPNGVNLDLCAKMSDLFGTKLDEIDPIKDDYVLEISSPGVDRILKKEKDFERFKGFKIKVTTLQAINNQKHFTGNLVAVSQDKIVVDDLTNRIVEIQISNILRAKLDPEF